MSVATAASTPLDPTLIVRQLDARWRRRDEIIAGLCAELQHVQAERDRLREAIRLAAHDIRNGWATAALYALEVAGAGQ